MLQFVRNEKTTKQPAFLDEQAKELRRFVRIIPNRPIPVRLPDGAVRDDIVHDISPAGMQLRCDKDTAAAVYPLDKPLLATDLPRVEVELTLPVAGKHERVSAQCRLCYVKQLLGGTFAMGMRFEKFDVDVEAFVRQFIEESLEFAPALRQER